MRSPVAPVAVLVGLLLAGPALAVGASVPSVTQCSTDQARALIQGDGVVLFHASWCPVCRAQSQVLASFTQADGLSQPVQICQVDYDIEDALKRELGVTRQSTFVRFVNGQETGRYLYKSDREEIRAFLQGE